MAKSLIAADTDVLNAQVFYDALDRLMGASIGVIAVRTREMNRGRMLMHQWASMRGMDFHAWDVISGWQSYRQLPVVEEGGAKAEVVIEAAEMANYLKPSGVISSTNDLLAGMTHYRTRQEGGDTTRNHFCGVMLGIVEQWIESPIIQQHIRDHVQRAYQNNDRMILMLTPGTAIPDAIVGDIEVIDLPTPSFAEMRDALMDMESDFSDEWNYTPSDDDRATITQNGLGMTEQEFQNAISLGIVDINIKLEGSKTAKKPPVTVDDFVKVVRGRKLEILKQTKILELMPEAGMDEVGGLDLLKAELDLQRDAFTDEARAYGIQPPEGFLVVGPPGTGKSLLCKATSQMLGLPAIKFDISSVFNSLVGSSEQRMRGTLRMVEEMAPCILFMDEIDKGTAGMGGGGNDSGVSARIFGTLLSWMQDKQDKGIPVFVVASANNVSQIPPELLRKGRFDDIWSVSFPSSKERADIFRIHVEKRGHTLTENEYKELANLSGQFVGSEIEAVVEAALRIDFRAGHEGVQFVTLASKIDGLVPQAKAFPEKIEAMKRWCEANARKASSGASFDPEIKGLASGTPIKRKGVIKPLRANRN